MNVSRIRKRKNYFDLSRAQKKKSKNLIIGEVLNGLNRYCNSMGLKVNEIKLGPDDTNEREEEFVPKLDISKVNITNQEKSYVYMVIKDFINLSSKKYKILRRLLDAHHIEKIPGYRRIYKIQKDLNNFFVLQKNDFGFFVDAAQKITFACSKFLQRNKDFKSKNIRIKLCADSVQISRKNINLLNFAFSIIDDTKFSKSVYGCFILGN